ncbi:hypothetical protein PPERSA_04219 [Pseudocohnilembus persalinus]|uniref:Uncharacterized protein n=1 Tax=Pseudocohnilembus persalinus TaxID=266149 RepID=A0A0V0QMU1_PSEPJ|nr:hypothetical protein PPERSA_04219 [Pseudocohnilembus persalinus]|eukprot:KRX03667.1 hypothetical protein PPERSA_04219 [Pseudocohnilembus persalinus]
MQEEKQLQQQFDDQAQQMQEQQQQEPNTIDYQWEFKGQGTKFTIKRLLEIQQHQLQMLLSSPQVEQNSMSPQLAHLIVNHGTYQFHPHIIQEKANPDKKQLTKDLNFIINRKLLKMVQPQQLLEVKKENWTLFLSTQTYNIEYILESINGFDYAWNISGLKLKNEQYQRNNLNQIQELVLELQKLLKSLNKQIYSEENKNSRQISEKFVLVFIDYQIKGFLSRQIINDLKNDITIKADYQGDEYPFQQVNLINDFAYFQQQQQENFQQLQRANSSQLLQSTSFSNMDNQGNLQDNDQNYLIFQLVPGQKNQSLRNFLKFMRLDNFMIMIKYQVFNEQSYKQFCDYYFDQIQNKTLTGKDSLQIENSFYVYQRLYKGHDQKSPFNFYNIYLNDFESGESDCFSCLNQQIKNSNSYRGKYLQLDFNSNEFSLVQLMKSLEKEMVLQYYFFLLYENRQIQNEIIGPQQSQLRFFVRQNITHKNDRKKFNDMPEQVHKYVRRYFSEISVIEQKIKSRIIVTLCYNFQKQRTNVELLDWNFKKLEFQFKKKFQVEINQAFQMYNQESRDALEFFMEKKIQIEDLTKPGHH